MIAVELMVRYGRSYRRERTDSYVQLMIQSAFEFQVSGLKCCGLLTLIVGHSSSFAT